MKPSPQRRGYALVMVLLFITLFLGLWSMAVKQIGTMLRIEQARAARLKRDTEALPAITALAQALAALEVGYPPSTPYAAVVGSSGFTAVYTMTESSDSSTSSWSVQVVPTTDQSQPILNPQQFITAHP